MASDYGTTNIRRPPQGFIPQIEDNPRTTAFVEAAAPPYVLIPINIARRLAKNGHTATSYFETNTEVITTSTVEDQTLYNISWDDEIDILEQFQPSYHIPADESIYESHDPEDRQSQLENVRDGTRYINQYLHDNADTFTDGRPTILPLIKGTTPEEYNWSSRWISEMNPPQAVFYGTQFFTADSQPDTSGFLDNLTTACKNLPNRIEVMSISGAGKKLHTELPSQVTAVTGWYQWYARLHVYYETDTDPPTLPDAAITEQYNPFAKKVNDALGVDEPVSLLLKYRTA